MANVPDDLLYSRQHEWVRLEGSDATVGITDYAQEQLGDLTFVEFPDLDGTYEQNSEAGVVESVKAASDICSPATGTVSELNEELNDKPELVNEDPYGDGWIYKMHIDEDPEGLMDAKAYEAYVESESE